MSLHAHLAIPPSPPRPGDDIVILGGMRWEDYEALLASRGDRSAPRIAYLEGTVEITSPSSEHESIKSRIGRLVETWCVEAGVDFEVLGSWTVNDRAVERGVEPDECYVFGREEATRPHLAIEVEWTRGGIDKLEIYRLLDVAEVWRWHRGRIRVYVLRGVDYHEAPRSELLPDLDLELLVSFLDRPRTSDAIRDLRAALRS